VNGSHALEYQVPVINPKAARSPCSLPNVLPSESKTVSLNVQAQDHLQISSGVPPELFHPVPVMSHAEPYVVQNQTSSRQLFLQNSPDSSHSHHLAYSSPGYSSNSIIPQLAIMLRRTFLILCIPVLIVSLRKMFRCFPTPLRFHLQVIIMSSRNHLTPIQTLEMIPLDLCT
jgi:hypothetical protein